MHCNFRLNFRYENFNNLENDQREINLIKLGPVGLDERRPRRFESDTNKAIKQTPVSL